MIAKTTTGNNFEGALTYGAGQRKGQHKEPGEAPLLVISNVIPGTPQQMAQEMQRTAEQSSRIQKPVWHTVLSWPPEEEVSRQQKVDAAKQYCELIGAPVDKHQVVVYEHRDTKHSHVHIYLNRVPIDGGPALKTNNNFYRQPGICKQISQQLGMQPLPERRQSLKATDPTKQLAREQVRGAVQQLLGQTQGRGRDWFTEELAKRQIQIRYTDDKEGILRGVSFETGGVALTGQEVGYKGAQLHSAFIIAQAQQQAAQKASLTPDKREVKQGPKKRGPRVS